MTGIGDRFWLKAVFHSARFCNRNISMLMIAGNRSVLPNSVNLAVEYVSLLDFSTGAGVNHCHLCGKTRSRQG